MKPIYILFFSSIFILNISRSFSQPSEGSYYVNLNGDTVHRLEKAYIDTERHPQLIRFRTEGNKKNTVSADSILYLRLNSYNSKKKKYQPIDYYVIQILTKAQDYCSHFVRNVYTKGNYAICYSPYCSQCGRLRFYVTENGKYVATFHKDNFRSLVEKHFSDFEKLVHLANNKKYSENRLYKILQSIGVNF